MFKKYLVSAKNIVFKPLKCSEYPMHLNIEPSTACNISCIMCDREKIIKEPKFLPFEKFKEIIDEIKPKFLSLNGYGETFIAPDLFKMISYARKYNIKTATTTNGICLLDNIQNVLDSHLNILRISLDASTEETYKKIRRNDNFDKIIAGIEKIISSRKNNCPAIMLEFVLMGCNKDEVLSFLKLAKKLNVDFVRFQAYAPVLQDQQQDIYTGIRAKEIKQILHQLKCCAKKLNIKTNIYSFLKETKNLQIKYANNFVNSTKKCVMPWTTLYVAVNGDIWPCCQLTTRDCVVGNIFDESISEIWNGEKMQRFREQIKKGNKPHRLCQMCIPRDFFDIAKEPLIKL